MKTLYIECNMGAAGDMLMAALLELLPDKAAFLDKMNSLMPAGVAVSAEPSEKCGITGTHVRVKVHGVEEGEDGGHAHSHDHHHHDEHGHGEHHHHHDHAHSHDHSHDHSHEDHDHHHDGGVHHHHDHHHSGIADIYHLIDHMEVSEKVKEDAKAVYRLIAEAESKVHGRTMEEIHFHEVGTLDAVADVVGNCLLMEEIAPQRIVVSPVHVGCGSVKCAHGMLPVPAPATALILEGIPVYGGQVKGELCTPTGAALLKHFADSFETMPAMSMEKIGYGMGTRDFADRPNCVRVILGGGYGAGGEGVSQREYVCELAANLDDMTAEEMAFAMEILMDAGALDVYCAPITMKKSRPAVKLVCLCKKEDSEKFAKLMLRHTSTLGVRETVCGRYTLNRKTEQRQTPWGPVDVKVSGGYGIKKEKAEFDRMAEIARETGLTLEEIKKEIYR